MKTRKEIKDILDSNCLQDDYDRELQYQILQVLIDIRDILKSQKQDKKQ